MGALVNISTDGYTFRYYLNKIVRQHCCGKLLPLYDTVVVVVDERRHRWRPQPLMDWQHKRHYAVVDDEHYVGRHSQIGCCTVDCIVGYVRWRRLDDDGQPNAIGSNGPPTKQAMDVQLDANSNDVTPDRIVVDGVVVVAVVGRLDQSVADDFRWNKLRMMDGRRSFAIDCSDTKRQPM